jgi:alkylated DNA repair dioxygenase AlkB
MTAQFELFDRPDSPRPLPALPEGMRYRPEVIGAADEAALLACVRALPFRAFEFHGYTGKRRVVSFGWQYDFAGRQLRQAPDIPAFLLPLRATAAAFAELPPEALQQALVSEYGPGAGIGWHRDKPVFGQVVGISLLAPCVFRFRRAAEDTWQRMNLTVEPRSAYLLNGAARWAWEHSIPPVSALRYSITFRTLRDA